MVWASARAPAATGQGSVGGSEAVFSSLIGQKAADLDLLLQLLVFLISADVKHVHIMLETSCFLLAFIWWFIWLWSSGKVQDHKTWCSEVKKPFPSYILYSVSTVAKMWKSQWAPQRPCYHADGRWFFTTEYRFFSFHYWHKMEKLATGRGGGGGTTTTLEQQKNA